MRCQLSAILQRQRLTAVELICELRMYLRKCRDLLIYPGPVSNHPGLIIKTLSRQDQSAFLGKFRVSRHLNELHISSHMPDSSVAERNGRLPISSGYC